MIGKIKRSDIGRRLLLIITNILSLINQIIPKKNNQILFYDSGRDFLDDNTEAIYSWLKENGFDEKHKFIVCVPKETKKFSFSNYEPVGAVRGVIAYLTTKYVFFSFGDFRIRPSRKQIVINQWHGTPLKKIGKLTCDINYQNERLDNFTYLIASSEAIVPILAKAFGCSENKVIVIGNARNDYLFSKKDVLNILEINRKKYKKMILWMPTFRVSNDDRFHDGNIEQSETLLPILSTYKELENIDELLSQLNILLVIKIHPMAIFKKKNYQNILIVTNFDLISKGVRLYEFVKEFDALITDYSSIYCDYLILDRPIGFTLDDYKEYERSRGFVFEHLIDYMAGYHMYKPKDVYHFISDIALGKDGYAEQRKKMQPIFCENIYGDNCKKLIEMVGL